MNSVITKEGDMQEKTHMKQRSPLILIIIIIIINQKKKYNNNNNNNNNNKKVEMKYCTITEHLSIKLTDREIKSVFLWYF